MSKEFAPPVFIESNNPEDIQERMMASLPDGIDDMPGGFPYDFVMPTAIEKSELIQFHLVRTIMLMFPQYAWDEWLDLHAAAAGIERRPAGYASGVITITGDAGLEVPSGTRVCTAATDDTPSVEYITDENVTIPDTGSVDVGITAAEPGTSSNAKAGTIIFQTSNIKGVSTVINNSDVTGGTERENDEALLSRIEMENDSEGSSYVGNDSDYIRWSKEVSGVGDCIVIGNWNGPGTVKLVLVDSNGVPANEAIVNAVYDHIVSPNDRSKRLLSTGCAELSVVAATTKKVDFACTGIVYDNTTNIEQIIADFKILVMKEYSDAKTEGYLIYNQIRAIMTDIPGVSDFKTFTMNGDQKNIQLGLEEYAATGTTEFS